MRVILDTLVAGPAGVIEASRHDRDPRDVDDELGRQLIEAGSARPYRPTQVEAAAEAESGESAAEPAAGKTAAEPERGEKRKRTRRSSRG